MLYIDLKRYVDSNEYTLSEIHEQTGISRNTLNLLYKNNDVKGIQLSTLEKLIDFFNISVSDIIKKENTKPDYSVSIDPSFKKQVENTFTSSLVFGFSLNQKYQDFVFPVSISREKDLVLIKILSPNPMLPAIIAIRSYSDLYKELLCADIVDKILNSVPSVMKISETDTIIFNFDLYNKAHIKSMLAKDLLSNPIQLRYMWPKNIFSRDYNKLINLKYE
ncbi:helix-turn-helix transcriptional regulator [Lactiplantibacillus plantarum]|uniref:helix-turn-helix domain-containing protein n=1 Tax=Lactiplantibacillus TaxID=2767842 RepID=UPI0013310B74|nr:MULTISPECIES: helix-turn-helix transcriptional regulator [Lactiplantibacillus]USZ60841.1 helix-turn-helix transcriptional regulator [Lactiplantibacillus plantarum]